MARAALGRQIVRLDEDGLESLTDVLVETSEPVARVIAQQLERKLGIRPLDRFERLWQLSGAQAAQVFGVSRQAYAKWHRDGVPAHRRADVRLVDETTQLLVDHVWVDRIPVVVRRPAPVLSGRSLLDLAVDGELRRVRDEVAAMFDLRRVQP